MTVNNLALPAERYAGVQRVLWRVLLLNLSVAFAKVLVGLLTSTLSMVADGFHSLMDASSNGIGIAGVLVSARPPDEDHPYGHRRFETMATLAIGGLLLVAAWEILKSALERLSGGGTADVRPISFAVMFGTMAVNVIVFVYERGAGKRYKSELLLADAAQTRVDFVISLSVIISLALSALGVGWADTAIALLIVVLIGHTAFGILRKTTQVLVDAAPINPDVISKIAAGVPGVENILRVRSRGPADTIYVDVDVQVLPATTADHAHAIADEIEERVKSALDGVQEVQVHFAPQHDQSRRDYALIARAAADALGMSIHEVTEILTGEGLTLEMHVEVSPLLTLAEAHQQVTELERRVRANVPEIQGVITHIEPVSGQPGAVMQTARAVAQRNEALEIAKELYPKAHWHDATIRPMAGGYAMTIHCWLPGTMSVQEAHTIAEHVETRVRAALPQVQRVTIHTEPPEET